MINRFMTQVNHLIDELKRVDLQYELEKAENRNTLEDMRGQLDVMKSTVQRGVSSGRDVETRVRLQDERVREMREILDSLGKWSKDTDRYIAVYEPIRTMNMVSDALTKSLEGSMLNKAIKYHE
jgi:type III secretory pathway component EscV